MTRLYRLLPLFLLLAAPPALAAPTAAEAEHTRLADEMKRLSGRNAWRGVDEAYRELEALAEKEGVVLTYRDHYLGATAARELGDVNANYLRLKRAVAVDATEEATAGLADIDQNYGEVRLKADPKYPGKPQLAVSEVPFDPTQRRAIEAAQAAIAETRAFEGILPVGSYTFGDRTFEILPGEGAAIEVLLQPAAVRGAASEGGLSYVGPRVDLGLGWTSAGAPSGEDMQADAFAGPGGRLGVGLELGFSTRFGVLAEVGYHGLYAGAPDGAPAGIAAVGSTLHQGFGWLALAGRLGDLRLALGPTYAVGVASTSGLAASDDPALAGVSEGDLAYIPANGVIRAGGVDFALFYGFLHMGKLQGGLGTHLGAQTDTGRWYSWGQFAFTLAPAAYRRDG